MKTDKNGNKMPDMLDRAVAAFDLPADVLGGMPKLTVTGNRRLHVESHHGLLEYDPGLIVINGGGMVVAVRGSNMDIIAMNAEEILIMGMIQGIDFE